MDSETPIQAVDTAILTLFAWWSIRYRYRAGGASIVWSAVKSKLRPLLQKAFLHVLPPFACCPIPCLQSAARR